MDRCAEHESSFMPVKYAADLFYYRSQFDQAAACYLQALSMAPEGYSMVRRELMDGLARCRLKMGRVGEALEVAKQLVSSKHTNKKNKNKASKQKGKIIAVESDIC